MTLLEVDRPALVLGSTQRPAEVADAEACARAGVEVVSRRSGGGVVLVEPGGVAWIDVWLPRGDPLWDDDVGRSGFWLGEAWSQVVGGEVHRGRLEAGRWGSLVCFAGRGPGEVFVDGAKAVGVAQRRTREGARFQCAVPLRWDAGRLASLLAVADRPTLAADLAGAVRVDPRSPDDLLDALLNAFEAPFPS